jgi:hypothetical protein
VQNLENDLKFADYILPSIIKVQDKPQMKALNQKHQANNVTKILNSFVRLCFDYLLQFFSVKICPN